MEIEIKIGKRTSDLRIEHYRVIQDNSFTDSPDLQEMIQIIHLYTNVSPSKIRMFTMKEIAKMYTAICKQFAGLKVNNEPKKELVFQGVKYKLIDPEKVGVGWHQDFRTVSIDQPTRLAAMFYLPDGIIYGEEDEYGNLKSSIRDRAPIFAEHMELQTFIDACAFFLRRFEKSTRLYTEKKKAEMTATKILKAMRLNKKESTIGKK